MTETIVGLFRSLILLTSLSLAAWTDWKTRKIPNRILLFLMAAGILLLFAEILFFGQEPKAFLTAAGGFLTGGGIYFFLYLLSRRGIGAGDVKLSAVIGFYLGSRAVLLLSFFAFSLAGCVCMILLLQRRSGLRQGIPFAPFLLSGAALATIWKL